MSLTVVVDVVNVVTICQKKKFGQIIENNSNAVIIQTEQFNYVSFKTVVIPLMKQGLNSLNIKRNFSFEKAA